jgi:glycosyltransferase involved in cell wall biosynthesis
LLDFVENISSIYNDCDAVISASLFEGWSLSLTEAAWLKKPIIATNVGDAGELSRYTDYYSVQNYPADLGIVNSSNLFAFSANPTKAFTVELSSKIIEFASNFNSGKSLGASSMGETWRLDSDYSAAQYFDYAKEIIDATD